MLRRVVFQLAWHLHRLVYRLTGGRAGGSGVLEQALKRDANYAAYEARAGRRIPVVVLEPGS
jgi:hypothetical protein